MTTEATWKKTACILCSVNCGIEVQTATKNSRRMLKVRGDEAHPISKGYLCEKAGRLDYYQNGADRLTTPRRRRADGTYEAISWDVAISEIADRFRAIKAKYGGESIVYYGGGAQGNHLCGAYGDSTLKALGVKYRSNAIAQEKTGEFWVNGKMFGASSHGDYEHCEVAIFIGKNPWQSHGFPRSRVVLREIANDPKRSMIVIDPRKTETAALADFHLQIKPATDAWCLAALVGIIAQERLIDRLWLDEHTTGFTEIRDELERIPIARCAEICGIPEEQLRRVAHRIASAKSVSVYEDLGMQMNLHSTLGSYLQRLIWVLTGNYGRQGTSNAYAPFFPIEKAATGVPRIANLRKKKNRPPVEKHSPVANARLIIGLIPCNIIAEEILTDHPKRYRAMLVEAGNPVHSLADSQRMREAFRALELSVVIDVAMTETARAADYVLPASSQFEKAEATLFTFEFPRNAFHLRAPVFEPLPGTLAEAEIHTRLLEAMGEVGEREYAPLRLALRLGGRMALAFALAATLAVKPKLQNYIPVILYRTLGPTLPKGMEAAAVVWGLCQLYVLRNREAAARAGFGGSRLRAADRLFQALLDNPSGVVFAESSYERSWKSITLPEHRIRLDIPELLPELAKLATEAPPQDPEFPFVLAAGERRTDTMNTAVRDAGWNKKGRYGTLRISRADAESLGCEDGERVRLVTRRGSVDVPIEISDMMQQGNVSLPNGQGLDYRAADGNVVRKGVPPNELTDSFRRDAFAGTPWHKFVPARVEKLAQTPS